MIQGDEFVATRPLQQDDEAAQTEVGHPAYQHCDVDDPVFREHLLHLGADRSRVPTHDRDHAVVVAARHWTATGPCRPHRSGSRFSAASSSYMAEQSTDLVGECEAPLRSAVFLSIARATRYWNPANHRFNWVLSASSHAAPVALHGRPRDGPLVLGRSAPSATRGDGKPRHAFDVPLPRRAQRLLKTADLERRVTVGRPEVPETERIKTLPQACKIRKPASQPGSWLHGPRHCRGSRRGCRRPSASAQDREVQLVLFWSTTDAADRAGPVSGKDRVGTTGTASKPRRSARRAAPAGLQRLPHACKSTAGPPRNALVRGETLASPYPKNQRRGPRLPRAGHHPPQIQHAELQPGHRGSCRPGPPAAPGHRHGVAHFGVDVAAEHRGHHGHDLEDRNALPAADVVRGADRLALAPRRGDHMCVREVSHVDVVADAGAVRGRSRRRTPAVARRCSRRGRPWGSSWPRWCRRGPGWLSWPH